MSGPTHAHRAAFSFAASPNQLLALGAVGQSLPLGVSVGRFAGRYEAIYRVREPNARVFAFVVAGAFEVEGRLLHEKDGLALWDVAEFELEALSNDAVVVVLEMAPK